MKKGLLLIILVLGMLLVGCGKEKETEITSENVVSEIKNENIDIEKLIDEFYTNEKYSQKINGVTCFNPEYKELIFETFSRYSPNTPDIPQHVAPKIVSKAPLCAVDNFILFFL